LGVTEGMASKGKEKRKRVWQIDALGLFPSPRVQTENDKRKKGVCKISEHPKEDLLQVFPLSPGRFVEKKREKDIASLGSLGLSTSSDSNLFATIFENLSK
jgi:hypothetical protein